MADKFLPLAHFLQRARVLALYRRTLRAAGRLAVATPRERHEMRQQITAEYRRHRHLTDKMEINACLLNADRQAGFLESGLANADRRNDGPAGTYNDDGRDKWEPGVDAFRDGNDVLGRVGQGWPWGNKKG